MKYKKQFELDTGEQYPDLSDNDAVSLFQENEYVGKYITWLESKVEAKRK